MGESLDVMERVRGFLASRAVLTAAELDLFTQLESKPARADETASGSGLDPRATTRLLDCLVTLGLLRKEDGVYTTSKAGARLSGAHPASVLPLVLHYGHLWKNWSSLTESVRQGHNPARVPLAQDGSGSQRAFIGAMHLVGRDLAAEIAAAYDTSRFSRLLDIGGGSGTYIAAFLKRNQRLEGVLFDLPAVISMAEERLRKEGVLDRATVVPGDFYCDDLPVGCDIAFLSAIIHQNSPSQNADLYRKIHRALDPGGVLLIRDHVMDHDRTDPASGAMFALNMLVCTDAGDTYTLPEIEEHLSEAGFEAVRLCRRGERMDCLVEARKTDNGRD